MTESNNRRLVVDLPGGIYAEQGYHHVVPERADDLTLLLYTNSHDVGGYGFQLVGEAFNFRNSPVSITMGESLCGEPDDFPQLRYRSFEEGFDALVKELREGNGDLELFLKPGVLKAVEGTNRLVDIVRRVPQPLIGEDGHEEILSKLTIGKDIIIPDREAYNILGWYDNLSHEQSMEIIKYGIHHWVMLRGIARSIGDSSFKMERLRAKESKEN